jgi:hypothetical protein
MNREVHIISYFSLPTDLAAEMRDWPEFVAGEDYSVDLRCPTVGETVAVRFVEEGQDQYVSVIGSGPGALFDRVLGRVVYALAAHSNNLMIDRHSPNQGVATHCGH